MEKPYKILIVPSSDDERNYEKCPDFDSAMKVLNKRSDFSSVHEFDTLKELNAFIQGYEAGVGYLGDGMMFTKHEN